MVSAFRMPRLGYVPPVGVVPLRDDGRKPRSVGMGGILASRTGGAGDYERRRRRGNESGRKVWCGLGVGWSGTGGALC
nr:unnamed protein product [Digitaria exilis]